MQVKSESNTNAIKFKTKSKVNGILKENAKQNISRSQSQLKLNKF